jgi:uncharacterized protein (DUF58 family)
MWAKLRHWFHEEDVPAPAPRRTPTDVLRRLQWTVLRPLATALGGDERSLIRGAGMELAEVREYQPGDDVRHIDWNTTARTEQVYVREAYAERALDVWLLLDVSASIDWGTAQCVKRDRLIDFVGVAGQLLGRRGHRIGSLAFAHEPLAMVPPGSGRMHLQRLIDKAQASTPTQRRVTNLSAALKQLEAFARRRSLVLIVSDFLVADEWQPLLRRMAQRHEVVAVQLADPREGELPPVGTVVFEDPETGTQLIANTDDAKLRERFRAAAEAQANQLRLDLVRCGAEHLRISTDADLLPILVRWLQARRQQRGGRAQPVPTMAATRYWTGCTRCTR